MFKQDNQKLIAPIRNVGCLYLSMLRMVELESGTVFSEDEVNEIWLAAKELGYIDEKNCMKLPDELMVYVKGKYKFKKTIATIGIEKEGQTTYWQWTRGKYTQASYKLEKVETYGKIGTHFRLCNTKNEVIFDSYPTVYKHKRINEYRLFIVL